jgi:5-methyltetrahydropteroyltriglutamate--homocysteine methyltransferase
MTTQKPPFRADHVGSLIRSQRLIEARTAHNAGTLAADALRAIEDEEIRAAIAMQERTGIQAVTDGELRRNNWRDRFFERVNGFTKEKIPSSFFFTHASGKRERGMPVPTVNAKLNRRETITASDYAFLKAHTKGVAKATLPAPSANHFFSGDRSLAGSPYSTRQAYMDDVTAIYRQEVADLAKLGCTYLQIDEVPIAVLCDPNNHAIVRERGEDPDSLINGYIAAINAVVRDRPATMTACVHLCRGNLDHGQASGGYDPVAQRLFKELNVDGFFLEYDTERAGSFEPLREVPKGKRVVLGMISTKIAALEPIDHIRRRIDDASKYVGLDHLCISPQCGFASSYQTNRFTHDDQERKLAHLVKIAEAVWR